MLYLHHISFIFYLFSYIAQQAFVEIWNDTNYNQYVSCYKTFDEINTALQKRGIVYEKWEAAKFLTANSTDKEILTAYKADIDRISKKFGITSFDVCQVTENNPKKAEIRKKFNIEHTHSDEAVRFFVEGSGCFYVHFEERKEIVRFLATKDHFLVLPKGIKHWFDMGPDPNFRAIRFFATDKSWCAHYTESGLEANFPKWNNKLTAKI